MCWPIVGFVGMMAITVCTNASETNQSRLLQEVKEHRDPTGCQGRNDVVAVQMDVCGPGMPTGVGASGTAIDASAGAAVGAATGAATGVAARASIAPNLSVQPAKLTVSDPSKPVQASQDLTMRQEAAAGRRDYAAAKRYLEAAKEAALLETQLIEAEANEAACASTRNYEGADAAHQTVCKLRTAIEQLVATSKRDGDSGGNAPSAQRQ